MLLPGTISPTWLLFSVLLSLIVISETLEGHRHARDVHRRADEDSDDDNLKKPKSKDSSGSDSDDHKKISLEKPVPKNSAHSTSESNEDNESNDKLHSTRALRPEDYEPEDSPKLHKFKQESAENDEDINDDEDKRRRKRSIHNLVDIEPEILAL